MEPSEILRYYEGRTDQICSAIAEIVDIESPSRNSLLSQTVTDWIVDRCSRIPNVTVKRRASPEGVHLVIEAFPGHLEEVLILGHTDTVHGIGTRFQNPTRVSGGRLYGCGVFDMKANIVVALEAIEMLSQAPIKPRRTVKMVFTCDEEIGSGTGRDVVESEAAGVKCCFVIEPSAGGKAKTGRKGTGTFTLTARGIPAHAGLEPERGANALTELASQVPAIHGIARHEAGTTVNVTTFRSGAATNVIPDQATCDIDVRFSASAEGDRVQTELAALRPADPRVTLHLSGGINRPPLERTESIIKLFERAKAIAASIDYALDETQVGGASDGNFVAALGIPVLDGLGIKGDGAHTLDEYIEVGDIAPRAALLTLLITDL